MTCVGLLFPGEMGAIVGAAADGDVLWASEGRSPATAARAEEAGFRDAGSLAQLVAESDLILSICPPGIAEEVAEAVAANAFDGVYVEANAISPDRTRRIAAETGLRLVDGGIIARTRVNLYLSGEGKDVEEVAPLFAGSDVDAIPLPGGMGAASALKMAFGGWNKIGVLLTAQAYAIAGAYGVALRRRRGSQLRAGPPCRPESVALGGRDGGDRPDVRIARPAERAREGGRRGLRALGAPAGPSAGLDELLHDLSTRPA